MALPGHLPDQMSSYVSFGQFLTAAGALVSLGSCIVDRSHQCGSSSSLQITAYCVSRIIHNLYFHPLSKYPGPKIAAISDIWWGYARYSSHQAL